MFSTKFEQIVQRTGATSQSPQFGSMFSTSKWLSPLVKWASLNPLNSGQCFQLLANYLVNVQQLAMRFRRIPHKKRYRFQFLA
ncbi:hypothetical protein D1AOALGA4SA_11694 [Olavius algarvensis Delta 1 endosymbiont]|nr:hypothetical protein D1AOALGA4SA_11694 [Olavius algarvensis Delta 1 endosymbiont]